MLPVDHNDPKALRLKMNPELWKETALNLCHKHGFGASLWFPFSAGSSLVAAVSESVVIKIIQPPYIDEYKAELWALKHRHDKIRPATLINSRRKKYRSLHMYFREESPRHADGSCLA